MRVAVIDKVTAYRYLIIRISHWVVIETICVFNMTVNSDRIIQSVRAIYGRIELNRFVRRFIVIVVDYITSTVGRLVNLRGVRRFCSEAQ